MRHWSCRIALAVACAPLASFAIEPEASPVLEYRPVLRSTLVSSHDVAFVVARWQENGRATTVLARAQAGAAPQPVAQLEQMRQGPGLQVSIHRLPQAGSGAGRAADETATLEQLYALLLRQDPLARYCLSSGAMPCDPAGGGVSHAEVLLALADARERVPDRPASVPWRVIEMSSALAQPPDADVVGARVTVDRTPLEGVAIYFHRAPHSLCTARTGANGVAVCRLVDPHGDDHADDHTAPVVATFPGHVAADRVLPPTTFVVSPPGAAAAPLAARTPVEAPGER